ncbi:MAG: helix-turn-helix domain-containing protein [Hyphomicrobiaceae bacterium]
MAPDRQRRPGQTRIDVPKDHAALIVAEQVEFEFTVASGEFAFEIEVPGSRRRVLDFLTPGDMLATRVLHGLGACRLRAMQDAQLVRESQTEKLDEHALSPALLSGLERFARRSILAQLVVALEYVDQRVASFLLLYARTHRPLPDSNDIELTLGRDVVSDYILVNPDTLSRSYSRFRANGVLKRDKGTNLLITNHARLAAHTPIGALIAEVTGGSRALPV